MRLMSSCSRAVAFILLITSLPSAQKLQREDWGGPLVAVSSRDRKWTIAGKKTSVTVDEADLTVRVHAETALWEMRPSSPKEMLVRSGGQDFYLRLADARNIAITPYDTGFKKGIKISLSGWR